VKIGEVAKRSDVTVDTVRYYERVGVLPEPDRRPSGYREYEAAIVGRIQLARELQAIGFSLTEIVDALAAHDAGGATCESERWRLDAVLERVDAKLAELAALRRRIVRTQEACASGHCILAAPRRASQRQS
jgi:DNA-binding transcriptional MerR regulator